MKVFILGLDALEFDLVEKFAFKNLKQMEYGKIDLSTYNYILTPPLWGTIISGVPPSVHGIQTYKVWNSRLLEEMKHLMTRIGLSKVKDRLIIPRKICEVLGLKREFPTRKNLKVTTIFDIVKESISIDVPAYNNWSSLWSEEAIESPLLFEKRIWKDFEARKRECLRRIEEDWMLFMVHFHICDYFGHLFRGNLSKMWEVYSACDELAYTLKSRVDDSFFLIISDHGMSPIRKGSQLADHSDHAFYSSNQKLALKNPKLTDFYKIILDKVGACKLKETYPVVEVFTSSLKDANIH